MKVSVIVPVHNSERHLRECVDSLRQQSHADLEIILVQNGSTDRSPIICQHLADRDHRVAVITLHKPSVSDARNAGIDHAKGQLVMFCDSDDWADSSWVSDLLASLTETHSDVAVAGLRRMREGQETDPPSPSAVAIPTHPADAIDARHFYLLERWGLLNSVCNKIYWVGQIRDSNVRFETSVSNGEDLLFNLKYFRSISRIGLVKTASYNYRIWHPATLSTRYQPNEWNTAVRVRKELRELLKTQPGGWDDYASEYWDVYLSVLERALYRQADGAGLRLIFRSIRINNRVLNSVEARMVIESADMNGRHPLLRAAFCSRNYFWIMIVRQSAVLRTRCRRTRGRRSSRLDLVRHGP